MAEMRFGLDPKTVGAIQNVFERHSSIEAAIVYGSRALGRHKLGSDIDITLIGAQLDLSELLAIENDLDDLMLPYKIDLSLHAQIENPDLLDHIKRVGLSIYERNS